MITKYGDICYRSRFSQCQKCQWFIRDYKCWNFDYISYMTWENCVGYECDKFKSNISNQLNNEFVFRDYESVPIKEYSGNKYRFDKEGNVIAININFNKDNNNKDNEDTYDNPFVDYGDSK